MMLNLNKNILVIMSDNRLVELDRPDYNSLAAVINYNYCKYNNYDFIYYRPNLNGNFDLNSCMSLNNNLRHSSWAKLLSTIKAMNENLNYEYIVYIDSDCIFNNINKKIEDHFNSRQAINKQKINNPELIFLNDKPWHPESPCAGFYIIKNTKNSLDILKTWYRYDDEQDKQFNLKHCWEQWALYKLLLTNYNENIVILEDEMFLNVSQDQFLRHIGTHENWNRIPIFIDKIKKMNIDYNLLAREIREKIIPYNTELICKGF